MPIWLESDRPEELQSNKAEAFSGIYGEGEHEGEKVIVFPPDIGGETMAHEIGHITMPEGLAPEGEPSDKYDTARRELQAWLWAGHKRHRRISTNHIVRGIAGTLLSDYPEITVDEVIVAIQQAYYDANEDAPAEEYIRGVIEKAGWAYRE